MVASSEGVSDVGAGSDGASGSGVAFAAGAHDAIIMASIKSIKQ
jgi:hypothetical protein